MLKQLTLTKPQLRQIIEKALNNGVKWRGGSYPSRNIVSYDGEATVELDGYIYKVIGHQSRGYWAERGVYAAGADGYLSITLDNEVYNHDGFPGQFGAIILDKS
jgi:hypothetical protein